MLNKKTIVRMFSVLLAILLMSSTVSAGTLPNPLGTAFTYQGRLTDASLPASGTYDFEFKLFDSNSFQEGSTITKADVTVTNGLFSVQLDFGDVFDGTLLYLEVAVRPGASEGEYTTLAPRQPLTAAPNALYAEKAPWSGLTGVPAGFADGVDNDTTYTAGDGLLLAGTQFSGKGSPYQNVVIVAKGGGDFTTVTAALDSITDADASNPYLIYITPGVYTEQVTMKQYVDIQGSGELITRITFTGSSTSDSATVMGADNAELRFLTVENTGSADVAIAILNSHASPRLTHLTVTASGAVGQIYGIRNYFASPEMTDVSVTASGGLYSFGVSNDYVSSVSMNNVTVSASGGSLANDGLYNRGVTSTATIQNSVIIGSGYTIYNQSGSTRVVSSQLSGAAAYLESGTLTCAGVYDENYVFYASTCP